MVLNIGLQLLQNYTLRPLVVELNFVRPRLVQMFDLDGEKTIEAVALGKYTPTQCIQKNPAGLSMIPARAETGGGIQTTTCLLRRILGEVEGDFDITLFDAPPLMEGPDTIVALGEVPRLVLVVQAARTSYEVLNRVKAELESKNVTIVGTILNKQKRYIPGWLYRWLVKS
jgi:Mrp family chromosome partitioning ATPase